jgi:hypothetical protein
MKSDGIKNLLDILLVEKHKEFDYNTIKGDFEYITDEKGITWKRPKK